MSKKHNSLAYIYEILIFLAIIALGSVFVYVVNQHLDRKMVELKSDAIEMLESKLGRKISYKNISPSIFGFLAVRELTVYSLLDPGAVLLKINRVKIYYNILSFILTRNPANYLKEVHIVNSQFHIDRERDKELLEFITNLYRPGQGLYPALGIKLSGANITLNYISPERGVKLSRLFFAITGKEDVYQLNIRCSVQYDHFQKRKYRISSRLKLNGIMDQKFSWSDLAVRIYSLESEGITLKRLTFQITFDENELKVRKIQDRAPLDVQFLYNLESDELTFQFDAENFRPSTFIQLNEKYLKYNSLLDNILTSSGTFKYNTEDSSFNYLLDLEAVIRNKRLPAEFNIVTHLFGDEKILYLEPLAVASEKGSVEFFGNILIENLLPAGFLQFIDISSFTGQKLNASFMVERQKKSLCVNGSKLRVGTTSFNNINLEIFPGEKEFDFNISSSLRSFIPNSINVSGTVSLDPEPQLSLNSHLSGIALNTLYRLVTLPANYSYEIDKMLNPYYMSMILELKTDFKQFSLQSSDVEITDVGNSNNSIRLTVQGNNQKIAVNDIKINWQDYRLSGNFQACAAEGGTDFSSSLLIEGYPYEIEGYIGPGMDITARGSYGLYLRFVSYDRTALWGRPFRLKVDAFPLPFKKGTIQITTDINGTLNTRNEIYAVSRKTEIQNIPILQSTRNSLQFSFVLQENKLDLNEILFSDQFSTLKGMGNFQLDSFTPPVIKGGITLNDNIDDNDDNINETYSLQANLQNNVVNSEIIFRHSPLGRLGDMVVSGDISGSVSVSGEIASPEIAGNFVLNDGRLNIDPLDIECSFKLNKERLSLDSLNIAYFSHRITNGKGLIDLSGGRFGFNSGYTADYFAQKVSLDIDLLGNFNSEKPVLSKQAMFNNDVNGKLYFSNIKVEGEKSPDWIVNLSAGRGLFTLDGGPGDAIHGQLSEDGNFTVDLADPLPIQGSGQGKIKGDIFEAAFNIEWMDMHVINTLTSGTDIFLFTKGYAYGSLNLSGLINDPDFFGILNVENSGLIFALSPDEIEPLNGRLIFEEKSFRVERTSSFSGRAEIFAEGVFYLDHWIPVAFELIFQTESTPGIRIRSILSTVSVDGFASGRVRVTGDQSSVRIEGDILVNSCRIALEKQEYEETEREDISLIVKMNFQTGPRVEFYWPSMTFPIIHTYAKQGERVSIYFDGDNNEFTLLGDVEVRGGEIFYFDRSFYLKRGSINFDETVEEIDPWIKALAEIRERDQLTNEVIKIYLEADNKLSQFSPRFYSEPLIPDIDIFNYIGGSIVSKIDRDEPGLEQLGISAVLLTSDVVSQFRILSPFEHAVRDILGLDLFSIRTQLVQNVLLERVFRKNIYNPLDNTTLSLGKYLGTDLFLEMLVRVQSSNDPTVKTDQNSSLIAEGELNLEWTTPFFLLEWSFAPKHPEDLFITDNSIGLKWKFSY